MSILGHFGIRYATEADVTACQALTRLKGVREQLPFVMLPSLREAVVRKQLFIAEYDGATVGFVHWYARRDGVNTVHEIAVNPDYQGMGIGRALLYSVPCPIRLKCKQDNTQGNTFYQGAGMVLDGTETTKGSTALNIWRLNILAILCRGGNKDIPQVARESRMAYGTRHDMKPHDWPYMLDIHWQDYDWQDYMHKVCTYRPVQAMCADYEHPHQRSTLYRQIRDLKAAGVLRVKICPKFTGAVAHIPCWCTVAISVPSSYAGFMPDFSELHGRRVHLLGGSPTIWFGKSSKGASKYQTGLIVGLRGANVSVVSADGNAHARAARQGVYWQDGKWNSDESAFTYHELCVLSGRNIVKQLNQPEASQLSMF
jgi:GNAT superfamily N-acetyltransferase